MKTCLSQGRAARARRALAEPVVPSTASPFPVAVHIAAVPESDPESWPRYVVDRDDEDGSFHLVDIDCHLEWDGWRIDEFDRVEGGDL
jgi:hypothetical protein